MECVFRDASQELLEYLEEASTLPQDSEIFYQEQRRESPGYCAATYGPWPEECMVFQMRIWSSHKFQASVYDNGIAVGFSNVFKCRSSSYKVLLFVCKDEILNSRLHLTGPLKRIFAYK